MNEPEEHLHALGTAERGDRWEGYTTELLYEGANPWNWEKSTFQPFSYCPHCGADVREAAAAIQRRFEDYAAAERARIAAKLKTALDEVFEKDAGRILGALSMIEGAPKISDFLLKPPLPEGIGYNYKGLKFASLAMDRPLPEDLPNKPMSSQAEQGVGNNHEGDDGKKYPQHLGEGITDADVTDQPICHPPQHGSHNHPNKGVQKCSA
jgi:hypothetical protein